MKYNIYSIQNSPILYGYFIELSTCGQDATCLHIHRLVGKDTWEFGGIHEELVSSLKEAQEGKHPVYRYLGTIDESEIVNAHLHIFQARDT